MKIISNFKDYYDYLTGIYGIDSKIIYERKSSYKVEFTERSIHHLFVLNKYYLGIVYQGILYMSLPELTKLFHVVNERYKDGQHNLQSVEYALRCYLFKSTDFDYKRPITEYPTDGMNEKHSCPVIYINWFDYRNRIPEDNLEKNVKLEQFKFSRIVPAKEVYLGLNEFLAYKEPEIKTNPKDMRLFESKGFSRKTSFRKM